MRRIVMARTQATLPGGARLSDYMSVNVISRFYPREVVCSALSSGGQKVAVGGICLRR